MTPAFNSALLHFLWQGAAVAALLWIVLLLLQRRAVTIRYAACCGALALMTLLPVITTIVLYQPVTTAAAPAKGVLPAPATAFNEPVARSLASLRMWALPLWSIGVLVFALRLAWGCRQVAAFRASGQPADDALIAVVERLAARMRLAGPIATLISARAVCPSVVGWLRPVILLPAATVIGLTPEQLEAVLAHELAHILRHDYLVNLLQSLAETLLFYHPAVWWVSRRIREERELCCDDLAVACCSDTVGYARALTELEKLRDVTPSIAMAGNGGSLMYRIQRLLGMETPQYGPSKLAGLAALCIGLLCVALNVAWVVRAQDPPKQISRTVTLEVTVDAQGDVSDARVLSGPMELRKAALRSALERHFPPGAAGARQVTLDIEPGRGNAGGNLELRLERSQQELENQARQMARKAEELSWRAHDLQNSDSIQQADERLRLLREQISELEQRGIALSEKEGRVLQRIDILGLSGAARDQLAGRLPVHVGDLLTHDLVEATTAAAHQVNAGIQYRLLEEGQVALTITVAESNLVQAGDRLTISVWQHPEASAEMTVGESCRITLPLINDVEVCGLNVGQLRTRLADQLGKFLQTPDIRVGMRRPGGKAYFTANPFSMHP